ncbi:MAG: phosphatidylglycerophosphatase A [Paracoccaceae bacterium]
MSATRLLSIWFGAGLLKPAPGTWGSAVAVLLGVLIHRLGHFPLLALATVAVTMLGFWAVGRELANRPGEDPSEIVIDEVAGQWLALCFPSAGFWFAGLDATNFPYPGWVAAFLFFRLFDIWKPWHVGRADRRGDAAGVMTDDLWAGLYAGIATIIAAGLSHGLMRMM